MSAAKGGSGGGRRSRAGSGGASGARPGVGGAAAAAGPASGLSAPLTLGRIGMYVLLLVAGVLVALAGTLVQGAWSPGGLLLALAGTGGLFYGGVTATRTAAGVLVPGAAWLVTVFLLVSDARPEGDFLFPAALGSYLFLCGGIVVGVICATVAQMRATGATRGRVGG
ncbi:hypothetical protein FCH28_28450 [Streptomyces piniterrae]|uniref:Integral membrane protein n=1 Tax=Streptomyces piniterrae TaxID=2571125 RepID=A0A4U0MW10_9ACTN|nr:DUF6113 family protein [Streptomyces piniterrae]TJZ45281.1 hypothetical protein FCH28_28450 [Streptomyces piniterrae]